MKTSTLASLLASFTTSLLACATPVVAPGEPVEPEPADPTCATTSCDAHATCSEASGAPVCTCEAGFSGNGATCADVNECAAANVCAAGNTCVNAAGGFDCLPTSCAGVLAAQPGAPDGTYTLYVNGDPAKSWDAFCVGMADANGPAEYLTLTNVFGDSNFSQYTAGGASTEGTTVRTSYVRLRINPQTLVVDIADERFSGTVGRLRHGGGPDVVTSMPFAVAMNCAAPDPGLANIDLRGTAFRVVDTFAPGGGFDPAQTSVTFDATKQVVDIHGGGGCGWNAPVGAAFNPFNTAPGTLKLGYIE